MREKPRPLDELRQELRELAVSIAHYERQARYTEEYQARQDYCGLLREICRQLGIDPARAHHPLLSQQQLSAGTIPIF